MGPNLRAQIGAFKGKSDTIMSSYGKAQAAVKTIDWDHYMQAIDNKDLVADFKAKLEALEIPEPVDTKSESLAAQAVADQQEYEQVVAKFADKEAALNGEIDRLCSLPPFEQMTEADIYHHFPLLDHRTSNWGYTDMSGDDRREYTLLGEPANAPDVAAYVADKKASK